MSSWQDAFAQQTRACRALGSVLTARVCDALARIIASDTGPVGQRVKSWPGDAGPGADSMPLRLCGALHALTMTNRAPALTAAYAMAGGAQLDLEIRSVIQNNAPHFLEWLEYAPQTNEVGRSGPLIAVAWFLGARYPGVRFDLLELGGSAGLNLNFPHYSLANETGFQPSLAEGELSEVRLAPLWRGTPPEPAPLTFGTARGVDLNPLDPARDGFRLMAYTWPDQRDRLGRLRAALAVAGAHPPVMERDDAGAWLAARLAEPVPHGRLVYHTVAAQYFPETTRARIETALQEAGRHAGPDRPLAHFSMEGDGGEGAALRLRLWSGGPPRTWHLGRADFHGRWIEWQAQEES